MHQERWKHHRRDTDSMEKKQGIDKYQIIPGSSDEHRLSCPFIRESNRKSHVRNHSRNQTRPAISLRLLPHFAGRPTSSLPHNPSSRCSGGRVRATYVYQSESQSGMQLKTALARRSAWCFAFYFGKRPLVSRFSMSVHDDIMRLHVIGENPRER
jgi:hypothetical protein